MSNKFNKVHTNKLTVDKQSCFKGDATFCEDIKVKGSVAGNLHITGDLCVDGDIKKTADGTFDVIIIGGGPAGAVCANRISEDPNTTVLLLEMGKNLNDDVIVNQPFGVTDGKLNLFIASVDHSDIISSSDPRGGPVSGDDRWLFRYEAGKALGGAGVHNYLDAIKSSPGFHAFMATRAGAYSSLWDANAAYTAYQEMEAYQGTPGMPNRGYASDPGKTTTPQSLLPIPACTPFCQRLLGAIGASSNSALDNALTITGDGDALAYNNKVDLGLIKQMDKYLNLDFTRAHPGTTFLGTTVMTSNGIGITPRQLKVLTGALVDHIEFDTSGTVPVAKRVTAMINGRHQTYAATKKIIICAGSIRTPGILERSGIGNSTLLSQFGIPVVVANPYVGEDANVGYGPGTLATVAPGLSVPGDTASYLINLDSTPSPYNPAWTRRIQGLSAGGTFPPFEPSNALLKSVGVPIDGTNTHFGAMFNVQPTSMGSVHIYDRIPGSTPIYKVNAFSTDEDVRIQREFLLHAKRVEQYMQINHAADSYVLRYPPAVAYAGYPGAPTNVFTGSIAGTVLTISAVTSGALELGCTITGAGILGNTRIVSFGTGTGGTGTYNISKSYTLGPITVNSDSLELYASSFQLYLYHTGSTCKMGNFDSTQRGVVDGRLHVHGTQNLMVADSSIFPVSADTGMIGAQLVGWIASEIYFATI